MTNPFFARLRFWGLLGAAGFCGAMISLAGFFGALDWRLEILSHFRIQYSAAFLLLAAVFAAGRRFRGAAGALALAALNAAPVLLFLLPPAPASSTSGPPLRAMLLNVNTSHGNPARVRDAIARETPDLLVLEEISADWLRELAPVLSAFPFQHAVPRHDNFGIGLFSRHPFESARVWTFGMAEIPTLFVDIRHDGRRLSVVATHPMPPASPELAAERNAQLDALARELAAMDSPVLLLGDLNVSPWSPVYRRFLVATGLQDSARGRSIQPTWPAGFPLLWIPLDHALHSDGLAVLARIIGPNVGSDHLPLIVDLAWNDTLREPAAP